MLLLNLQLSICFEDFGDNSVTGILNNASILEYWNIDNTGTASNADVTLHWKSAAEVKF